MAWAPSLAPSSAPPKGYNNRDTTHHHESLTWKIYVLMMSIFDLQLYKIICSKFTKEFFRFLFKTILSVQRDNFCILYIFRVSTVPSPLTILTGTLWLLPYLFQINSLLFHFSREILLLSTFSVDIDKTLYLQTLIR